MRRGVLPFGLVSLLPAPGTRAGSALPGLCHVPVWVVGRLVRNQVRELIHGKKRKMERGVWGGLFSFPRPFFLSSASHQGLPETLQQTFSDSDQYFPSCQGKYKQWGKTTSVNPKACKPPSSTLKNGSDRGLWGGGMLGGCPQGPPCQIHVLPPAPQPESCSLYEMLSCTSPHPLSALSKLVLKQEGGQVDEKLKASLLATGNSFPGRKSVPELPKFLPDLSSSA